MFKMTSLGREGAWGNGTNRRNLAKYPLQAVRRMEETLQYSYDPLRFSRLKSLANPFSFKKTPSPLPVPALKYRHVVRISRWRSLQSLNVLLGKDRPGFRQGSPNRQAPRRPQVSAVPSSLSLAKSSSPVWGAPSGRSAACRYLVGQESEWQISSFRRKCGVDY